MIFILERSRIGMRSVHYVGDRGKQSAYNFIQDAADRIVGRPQITTDAHRPYLQAVLYLCPN